MVFVYGGGYLVGMGEMYPGYGLALHGDMIVVNFNYRVSTLGWLSTGQCLRKHHTGNAVMNQLAISP